MKRTIRPASPGAAVRAAAASNPMAILTRIKLALLEDEPIRDDKGYDPYDTAKSRPRDVWASKRKRA
jgi:hypothetical protein